MLLLFTLITEIHIWNDLWGNLVRIMRRYLRYMVPLVMLRCRNPQPFLRLLFFCHQIARVLSLWVSLFTKSVWVSFSPVSPLCVYEKFRKECDLYTKRNTSAKLRSVFFSLLNMEKIPLKRCFLPYFSAMQSHRQWNWYDKIESKRFNFVFKILKAHFFSNHNQMEHVL